MDEQTIEIKPVTKEMLDEYINIHNKLLPVQYPQKWYEQFFSDDNRIALAAIDNTINLDENQNLPQTGWIDYLLEHVSQHYLRLHLHLLVTKLKESYW